MSLTEEPYYLKRDCSPMCNHQEECVRCHNPHCIKYMYHSRLHGYTCICGSQEWKPVFELPKQGSGLTQRALDWLTPSEKSTELAAIFAICEAAHNWVQFEKGNYESKSCCAI